MSQKASCVQLISSGTFVCYMYTNSRRYHVMCQGDVFRLKVRFLHVKGNRMGGDLGADRANRFRQFVCRSASERILQQDALQKHVSRVCLEKSDAKSQLQDQ